MILIEENFNGLQYLSEGTENNKKTYVVGTYMEGEIVNKNGRVYPKSQISAAVKSVHSAIAEGRDVLGALDHPSDLIVTLKDAAIKITEMQMQGNNAIGKALILEHVPNGQIALGLLKSGVNLGISSRGSGSVNEDTGIVESFNFITADLVATPSAPNAMLMSVREQLELYKRGGEINHLAEAVLDDKAAQKYFEKELIKFIGNSFK